MATRLLFAALHAAIIPIAPYGLRLHPLTSYLAGIETASATGSHERTDR